MAYATRPVDDSNPASNRNVDAVREKVSSAPHGRDCAPREKSAEAESTDRGLKQWRPFMPIVKSCDL